jgi:hypothetical protein
LTLDEIVYRLRRRLLDDAFASRNSDLDAEAQGDFNSGNSSQANKRNREQRPKIQPFLSTTNIR